MTSGTKGRIMDMAGQAKGHLPYVALISILSFIFLAGSFNLSELPMVDHTAWYYTRAEILRQSFEMGDYNPLWNPYIMSGTPLYAQAGYMAPFPLLGPLLFVMQDSVAAIKMLYYLDMLLAGIFMYLLGAHLFKRKESALVVGILYMINGFAVRYYVTGAMSTLGQYAVLPLVFLFFLKSFKSETKKQSILFSIVTGTALAVQLYAGSDMKIILWESLMFALYAAFYLAGNDLGERIKRTALIGLVILFVFGGLSAMRALPIKEYLDLSSRGDMSYEQSATRPVSFSSMPYRLIEPYDYAQGFFTPFKSGAGEHIGIIAFALACFAVYRRWNNKFIMFLLATILLGVLAVSGTFVYRIIWTLIPFFHSMRYLERGIIIIIFPAIILAGYGSELLFKRIEAGFASKGKRVSLSVLLVVIIIIDLCVFGYIPTDKASLGDIHEIVGSNEILTDMAKDSSHFRMHAIETMGIDWDTEYYGATLGLEDIYGYESAWYPPYFNGYLSYAMKDPAKMWGILNTKYITAIQPYNVSGLTFKEKFSACRVCPRYEGYLKAHGPYLYENDLFMPRAYSPGTTILVAGKGTDALVYQLMLDPRFDPKKTVVVQGELSQFSGRYGIFDAIMLVDGAGTDSLEGLRSFAEEGKILLPDVANGKNQVSDSDISDMFSRLNRSFTAVSDSQYKEVNFDRYDLLLDKKVSGWVVLSEKFSVFPGWVAKADGKRISIYRSDAMISAVYLEEAPALVTFEYTPDSYATGKMITIISIFAVVAALLFLFFHKGRSKGSGKGAHEASSSGNAPHHHRSGEEGGKHEETKESSS